MKPRVTGVPTVDLHIPTAARLQVGRTRSRLEWQTEVELPAGITQVRIRGLDPELRWAAFTEVRATPALVLSVEAEEVGPSRDPAPASLDAQARAEALRSVLSLLDQLQPRQEAVPRAFAPDAFIEAAQDLEAFRRETEDALRQLEFPPPAAAPSPHRAERSLQIRLRMPARGVCRLQISTEAPSAYRVTHVLRVEEREVSLGSWATLIHSFGGETVQRVDFVDHAVTPRSFAPPTRPWLIASERPYDERSEALLQRRPARPKTTMRRLPPPTVELPPELAEAPSPTPGSLSVRPGPYALRRGAPLEVPLIPAAGASSLLSSEAVTWVLKLRPAADPRAFLRLRIAGPAEAPISGGRVQVFVQGIFRGTHFLGEPTLKSPWTFDTGPEPSVVAHRTVRTHFDGERLIPRGDVHRVEVEIQLESSLSTPCSVRVEDQIPVSNDPRVRIRFLDSTPPVDPPPQATGGVAFGVELGAQSRHTLRFSYEIDAPRDFRLVQSLGAEP